MSEDTQSAAASDTGTMGAPAPDTQPAPTPQQAGITPSPAPQVGPPAAPPAAPAQPGNKWANVVKGALAGLAEGGAPGFVAGAIAPTAARQHLKNMQTAESTQVKQAAANVQFTSAQAAQMQSETAMRQIQMEHLPQQYKEETQKNDLETSKFLLSIGAQPTVTTSDATPEAFQAGLKTVNDAGGGVPPLGTLHVGTHLLSWDLGSLGNNSGVLPRVNDMLVAQGQKPLDSAAFFNKSVLPPAAKNKLVGNALTYFNPTPEVDPDKLKVQTSQYAGALKNVESLPDGTPHKDTMVADLTAAVAKLKAAPGANGPTEKEKSQIRVGTATAQARANAFNSSKPMPVLDDHGNLVIRTAAQAEAGNFAPAGEGSKAMSKQSQLQDIKVGLDTVRSDVGKLDTPFSTGQVAQLSLAINSPDKGVVQSAIKALNAENLSDPQKQFVVDITQLHERALSIRNIAGMGQGSDMMRQAVVQMLPGAASGDREMMTKQLDAMDNQIQVLGKGIAKVNVNNAASGKISVTDPAGGVHTFPDQKSADNFKRLAKIQ